MTFEGGDVRVVAPLYPTEGKIYVEPAREDNVYKTTQTYNHINPAMEWSSDWSSGGAPKLENIYKITSRADYYVNPTADGVLSRRSRSSCSADSEADLDNWQNRLHEVSTRRCARVTK